MVNCEHIRNMEVTRDELLVILDLIQEVREVSVLTLLLEWICFVLPNMVVFVIDLLTNLIEVAFIGQAVHHGRFHLACAVRVLVFWMEAHLAVVTCIGRVTGAASVTRVPAAKAITRTLVLIWHANCDLAHSRRLRLWSETRLTLMA